MNPGHPHSPPSVSCRYEIEYDQIRLEIAKEIGRKFLGFDIKEDGTATSPSKEAEGDAGGGGEGGCGGDGENGENVNNRVTSNSTTVTMTSGGKDILGLNGDGPDLGGDNKFVLDVLNDELVERVREKMLNGSKDLFESAQTAVKSFLAGEPFQEFEHSMYFHR